MAFLRIEVFLWHIRGTSLYRELGTPLNGLETQKVLFPLSPLIKILNGIKTPEIL